MEPGSGRSVTNYSQFSRLNVHYPLGNLSNISSIQRPSGFIGKERWIRLRGFRHLSFSITADGDGRQAAWPSLFYLAGRPLTFC